MAQESGNKPDGKRRKRTVSSDRRKRIARMARESSLGSEMRQEMHGIIFSLARASVRRKKGPPPEPPKREEPKSPPAAAPPPPQEDKGWMDDLMGEEPETVEIEDIPEDEEAEERLPKEPVDLRELWERELTIFQQVRRFLVQVPSFLIAFSIHTILLVLMAMIIYSIVKDEKPVVQTIYLGNLYKDVDQGNNPTELPDPGEKKEQPEENPDNEKVEPAQEQPADQKPQDAEERIAVEDETNPDGRPAESAYANRKGDNRNLALQKYGGGAGTEEAVNAGLLWLSNHQHRGGYWSANNFSRNCDSEICSGTGKGEYDSGITGLSLLAFLGGGHTPTEGEFKETVKRAVDWLLTVQNEDGAFSHQYGYVNMYNHAICTFALAECHNLAADPILRESVERAVKYIVVSQQLDGGWDYWFKTPSTTRNDVSITGWCILALDAAAKAGIEIPEDVRPRIAELIKRRTDSDTGEVVYANLAPGVGRRGSTMVSVGLLGRVYLGIKDREPLIKGVRHILDNMPDYSGFQSKHHVNIDNSYYYWYTGMLALFHLQGTAWPKWNEAIKAEVVPHQETEDHAAGSWAPVDDWCGINGGRVYSTAICVLMLETYYRYVPKYDHVANANPGMPEDMTLIGAPRATDGVDVVQETPIDYFTRIIRTSPDSSYRQHAIAQLADMEGREVTDLLLSLLDDKDSLVRWKVVAALHKREHEVVLPILIDRLGEGELTLQVAILRSLGEYGEKSVVPEMTRFLSSSNPALRNAARDGLTALTGRDLGHEAQPWLEWAESALPATQDPKEKDDSEESEQDEELRQQLTDISGHLLSPDDDIRLDAVKELVKLNRPEGEEILLDAIAREQGYLVPIMIQALAQFGTFNSVPVLIEYAKIGDRRTRKEALDALQLLTEKKFGYDTAAWERWYLAERENREND